MNTTDHDYIISVTSDKLAELECNVIMTDAQIYKY